MGVSKGAAEMEIIQSVETIRSIARITLENGTRYWIPRRLLQELNCAEGETVDEKELADFVLLHQYPAALNRAVSMLARRPCSQEELRQKLRQIHYSDDTVDMVLYKLNREKLLNDREFAMQWAHYRSSQRYGARRIEQELKSKGIMEEDISCALSSLDEETENEGLQLIAEKLIRRNRRENQNPAQLRQKVMAAIVRRGFDWDEARGAFERALEKSSTNEKES